MHTLQRLLEWYLGIAPATTGEGVNWELHTQPPWPTGWPFWLVLLISLIGVWGLWAALRRDASRVSRFAWAQLFGLRLATLLVVLTLLCEPTLTVDRTGLPSAVVMVDTSASMSLLDRSDTSAPATEKQTSAQSLATSDNLAATQRLAGVQQLLGDNNGRWLQQIALSHQLRLYQFAGQAESVTLPATSAGPDWPAVVAELKSWTPDGTESRPGPALRQVLADLRGTPPAAIVILTDGIASTGDSDRLSTVADELQRQAIPLYTVGVGSEAPSRDLQLFDTRLDEVAFVGDVVLVRTRLRGFGLAGQTVDLQLRRNGDDPPLARQTVTLPADGQAELIELSFTPDAPWEGELTVEAAALTGETDLDNNREQRPLSVRDEKIRVLLVEAAPRYEFRYLKPLLERDRSIELSTLLQDADLDFTAEDRTAIQHFPVRRDELFQYDVVIFGDVAPGLLGPAAMENLVAFVREKGGGLIFLAGTRHLPLDYSGTPLEPLFPFAISDAALPDPAVPLTTGFRPLLTPEGRTGSVLFRFGDTEPESQTIWNELPPWYWAIRLGEPRPGALVLVEHPTDRTERGKRPLILLQRSRAGKVLFHATDELWRWRFRVGDAYFGRYWVQAIRFLSRSRLLGQDRLAELTSDRLVYQSGEHVTLRVRFVDDQGVEANLQEVEVMLEREGAQRQKITLARTPQTNLVFEKQLPPLAEGAWHAWIATPSFPQSPPAVDFRVEGALRELTQRSMNRTDLELAARRTGGGYWSLAEANQLPAALPRGEPVTLASGTPLALWSRWEPLLLVAGLLTCEWLLRQRNRLL